MNEYMAEITLDLDCRKFPPRIAAGQYDKGRKCLIHITANDVAYSAAGATAVIKGRRKDKSYFSENCSIDNSGNVVFTMSEAALAVSGFVYAKVVLADGAKTYSSHTFISDIEDSLDGIINEFYNSKTIIITAESTHMQIPTAKAVYDAICIKANSATTLAGYGITDAVKIADAYETGATIPTGGIAENDALDRNTIYRYHNINGAVVANMICMSRTEMSAQIRFAYDGGLRVRVYNSGTWTSWNLLATKAEVDAKVPNTRKIAGIALSSDVSVASLKTALSVPDVSDKADKATTLAGYGIKDGMKLTVETTGTTIPTTLNQGQFYTNGGKVFLKNNESFKVANHLQLAAIGDIPTKTSDLTNDSGFLTSHQDISGKMNLAPSVSPNDIANVTEGQLFRSTGGIALKGSSGYTELAKKSDIPTVPSNVSAFQNDAGYLTDHQDISGKENISNKVDTVRSVPSSALSTKYPSVACMTEYVDNIVPTIPTNVSAFVNDAGYLTQHQSITGKVDKTQKIAGVDLQDDVTAAELKTALSVPTKTSDLANDSGYLTAHQDISGKQDKQTSVPEVPTTEYHGSWIVDTSSSEFLALSIGHLFHSEFSEVLHTYQKTGEDSYIELSRILHEGDLDSVYDMIGNIEMLLSQV